MGGGEMKDTYQKIVFELLHSRDDLVNKLSEQQEGRKVDLMQLSLLNLL